MLGTALLMQPMPDSMSDNDMNHEDDWESESHPKMRETRQAAEAFIGQIVKPVAGRYQKPENSQQADPAGKIEASLPALLDVNREE